MDDENNLNDDNFRGEGEAPEERTEGGRRLPPGLPRMIAAGAGVLIALYLVVWLGIWTWGLSRIYIGPGEMLVLTAKFGETNPLPGEDIVVPAPYKGIRERVYGEGRHFFNPITFERDTSYKVIEIRPGQIGLIESKSGKSLPPGEFLAEPGYKGIMRRVLTPEKWRLNPYAFEVTALPATIIEPGFVGCVTSLSGKPSPPGRLTVKGERGIMAEVLQPGIHYLNPREYKVDIVEIGYRQISLTNVAFPSKDGFTITLDISVVWGLEPHNVPRIINDFGNLGDVVRKVIYPQVESICRIEGSKYGAKEFIEGKTRERFQNTFTDQLEKVCKAKNISVLIGLVREINIPTEVRIPIQQGKIAVEEKLTKVEQRTTQAVMNELGELEADVRKGVREVEAETEKMIAEVHADGQKEVSTIEAETEVQVAAIQLLVARLDAQRERLLGKAGADVEEMKQTAQADELAQNIEALGSPEDYARYIFARSLPEDIKIFLRYAGPGTLWTDLPAAAADLERLAAMRILQNDARKTGEKEK